MTAEINFTITFTIDVQFCLILFSYWGRELVLIFFNFILRNGIQLNFVVPNQTQLPCRSSSNMLSTAGPSCPTCGASIEPGTHLYSEIANSSWHGLCRKHTTSTEMHLTIVWFNHELFKHVDAKHRCTAIICQMLLKKRKDLYYLCCTSKRKDLYYICCTEEEKGPLLYLLY